MLLLNIDMSIWTGKAKLEDSDTPGVENFRPPKDLASGGTIKIYDPRKLDVFQRIKATVNRYCESQGLKLLGGYLVDEARLPGIEQELGKQYRDWQIAVADLVNEYPDACQQWRNANSAWANLLAVKQPDPGKIATRFAFSWQTFNLSPAATQSPGNDTANAIQELPSRAMQELCDQAYNLYAMSFANKDVPSAKAWLALSKLCDRCQALAFVNPDAARLGAVLAPLAEQRNAALTKAALAGMDTPEKILDALAMAEKGETVVLPVSASESTPVVSPMPEPELEPTPVVDELVAEAEGLLAPPKITFDSMGLF